MNDKILNTILMNIGGLNQYDQKGEPIYSGDILIKNDNFLGLVNAKFENLFKKINTDDVSNTVKVYAKLFDFIKINTFKCFSSHYSIEDIVIAEYFNIDIFKNPILFFHGSIQSMNLDFNKRINDETDIKKCSNYIHLSEKEANEYKIGIYVSSYYETTDMLIKKLNSKFIGKIEILKTFSYDKSDYVIFKYKISNLVSYKKAKKIQKGVIERINWYKNYNDVKFPWLHYSFKNQNLFELALNDKMILKKYNSIENIFDSWLYTLYYFERRNNCIINHSDFSLFCTKFNKSKKRIYFFKGFNNE